MGILNHLLLFLFSSAVIWFFSGLLIDSVDRVAKRINQTGFTVAFFVLGFLTSISEISVAVNSSLEHQPQISAGNLVGASLVILMLIVPLLAIANNGISLKHTISRKNMALALGVIMLPPLFVMDGVVSRAEGIIILMFYSILIFSIRKKNSILQTIELVDEDLLNKKHTNKTDAVKILLGAMFIFGAGHILVSEGIFFSSLLGAPSSLIGLVALSIGTNVPEIVIAVRSILKNHAEIAFGDYLGSAVANTPIFGLLALFNGKFSVEPNEFLITCLLMGLGLVLFYIYAGSKNTISKKEGFVLLYVYIIFFIIQTGALIKLSLK